jgi:hypothetical protein
MQLLSNFRTFSHCQKRFVVYQIIPWITQKLMILKDFILKLVKRSQHLATIPQPDQILWRQWYIPSRFFNHINIFRENETLNSGMWYHSIHSVLAMPVIPLSAIPAKLQQDNADWLLEIQ